MEAKLARLREIFASMDRVLVAFSGGVDSTFALRVAVDVLGDRVVALTTRSPTAVEDDEELALRLGREFGVRHLVVDADELEIPGYAANPVNRCYFCKDNLYVVCAAEARRLGIVEIVDGANVDDLGDYRPGLQAATEHGVRHPLVEAGLTKAEIRRLSHDLGLPTWDKPSSPCLSSRFPYGTEITREGLARVAAGERALRQLGFAECRVRYHDRMARIEVAVDLLPRLLEPEIREQIVRELRAAGFQHVTVDLQGFRSGSLNEGIGKGAASPGGPAATPPTPDLPDS